MDVWNGILQKNIRSQKAPSVQYFLFDADHILRKSTIGMADISSGKPVDELTSYHFFSVTKTFTALAVLQLVEKKLLNLEEAVCEYWPDFPYPETISIKHLLTHTAGLSNPLPLNWIHLVSEHAGFNRNEYFEPLFKKYGGLKNPPGEQFHYSNLGFILLGRLIEIITGKTYEAYITEHIFNPLHLGPSDIGFEIPGDGSQAKGYQRKYTFINLVLGFMMDKSKFMDPPEGKWRPFKNFYIDGVPYGGLIGRPLALVKYIQELLDPESVLISGTYKRLLFEENYLAGHKPTGMCLSWFRGKLGNLAYFTHAGGGGGYYCEIRIYPEAGIGSVLVFNRTGMSDERFLDRLDKDYFAT